MTRCKLLLTLWCGTAVSLSGCQTHQPRTSANAETPKAESPAEPEPSEVSEDGNGAPEEGGTDDASDDEPSIEEQLALDAVRDHLQAGTVTADAEPLRLAVVQQGPHQPWVMGVVNQGEAPALLVADPRLVTFDVKVPGKKGTTTCQLPGNLRPSRAERRYWVWLAPGQGVVKAFDPRLYCFASSGQHVLVPGAIVTPRFGWPEKVKTVWRKGKKESVKLEQTEPFVARVRGFADDSAVPDQSEEPTPDAAEPAQLIKELRASAIALDSAYSAWASAGIPRKRKNQSPIVIDMKQGSDAHSQLNATVAITLKNRDTHTRYVYFRRELLSFEVMGPGGPASCDPQPDIRAPDRQAFLRLRSGQSMTITSRLVELCPKGTFSRPGFYLVHARFETYESGAEFGLDAYVGRVASEKPANVRIRTGELAASDKQALRPLQVVELAE